MIIGRWPFSTPMHDSPTRFPSPFLFSKVIHSEVVIPVVFKADAVKCESLLLNYSHSGAFLSLP